MVERIDRLGRVTYTCPGCTRRKAGLCQRCPKPVVGKVGVALYCTPCRKQRNRESVMRWQRNNLAVVARGMRRRRWKAKGLRMPAKPLTKQEVGRMNGAKAAAARNAKLSPAERSAIAGKAGRARWAKHRRLLCQTESSSVAEKSLSPTPLPPSGRA